MPSRRLKADSFRNPDFSVDLTVPVKFPPKVNNYLNAQGFEAQQKVYMAAQRMTFAEAGL